MDYYSWFVIFAAFNGLLILLLALNISRLRITEKIPYGDGGSVQMSQAIRAHANAVEHVTIYGFMLLALILPDAQAAQDQADLVAVLVGSFTLARFIHAYGMLGRVFNARRLGAGITYLSELAVVVILFAKFLPI